MNATVNNGPEGRQQWNERDATLVDIALILARRAKIIFGLTLLATIVAAVVCFFLPNVYVASTRILPAKHSSSSAMAMIGQLGALADALAGDEGAKGVSELYIDMLRSRTVADGLVAQFGLTKVYAVASEDAARAKLLDSTKIVAEGNGIIRIEVDGYNKKLVAPLANAYVSELIRLSDKIAGAAAAQRRAFFARELELSQAGLAAAEKALKDAVDVRGLINVDSESRAITETSAQLRAKVAGVQIRLDSLHNIITPTHDEYKRAEEELKGLKAELARLESGNSKAKAPSGKGIGTSAGIANNQLLRDMKYYETLTQLLSSEYEVARLDEGAGQAMIQVLDKAVEPERKSGPKRAVILLIVSLTALFLTTLWSLFSALWNDARSRDGDTRVHELTQKLVSER